VRKLWVVALANLAVIGLVLTAIITNVISACSSADGCGSAPPYIYIGLVLVVLGCAGLFLLFRKWRGATASADGTPDMASDEEEPAPKRKRSEKTRSDKASRAEQRDADAAEETSSRNRLGRIRGAAGDPGASHDSMLPSDDVDPATAMSVEADVAADWPSAVTPPAEDSWATDDWDDAEAEPNDLPVNDSAGDMSSLDAVVGRHSQGAESAADDENDHEFGVAWAVDDVPAISPSEQDVVAFDLAQEAPTVTLPIMVDDVADDDATVDGAVNGHISLDQIFAGPPAAHGDFDPTEVSPAVDVVEAPATAPMAPKRFDDCAPTGFPSIVRDLRALIAVLRLDILLDKQARDDIAAWAAVLAPLDDGDAVGPADCEAFAQWIDALAERHNADLAATVAHALQQRGGGDHDPYRSAA
jgi:hypothetical protein